jgi:hypothetical protein
LSRSARSSAGYTPGIGKTSPDLLKTVLFRVNEVDKETFQKSSRRNRQS